MAHQRSGHGLVKAAVWLALVVLALCLSGAGHAAGAPDGWRGEARRLRVLAENDPSSAYEQAQRLQADLPAGAPPADQALVLNLLARCEVYLALTDDAARHAQLALNLALQNADRVGQAEAHLNVVLNAINQAKIDVSVAATTQSVELVEGVNRPDLLGEALLRMSMMYRRLGDMDNSVTMAMQAMELAKRGNSALALTYAHQGLAISFEQSGHYAQARAHYQNMRDQARIAQSKMLEAHAVQGLALVAASLGDAAGGERLMREAVAMLRSLRTPFSLCHGLFGLADVFRKQGRHAEAVEALDEAVAIYAKYPNRIGLWFTLNARGTQLQVLHRMAAARADAERAYALAKEIDVPVYLNGSARRLAELAATDGDYQRAYQLSAEASAMADKSAREKSGARMIKLAQRYETESKQREINELTRRNEEQTAELRQRALQQRWLWTVLGGGAIAFAGTAYFLLFLRRSNRMLEALNTQVQRSQNKLQATLDAIPDLMFVLGLDGRYHDFHSPRTDLLAAPAESLISKTVQEVLPPDAAEVCLSALREANETGMSTGKQFELQLPQGKSWFELSVARKSVGTGEEPRFVVLSRDITERKAHIRDLQRWQDIFEHAEWGVVVGRVDGRTLDLMNPAFARMHGYTVEELTGQSLLEVFAPDHRESVPEHIRLAHQNGHHAFESWHLRKDGTIFPVFIDVTTVRGPNGQVTHRIVNVQDITERKSAEEALRESEEKYRTLIQKIQAAVVVHGADTQILTSNAAAQEILGLSEEQLNGKTIVDPAWHFFREDGDPATQDEYPVNQVLASRKALKNYVLGIHRPGHEDDVWALVNADPVFGKNGELVQIIVTFIDITQRKKAEEALADREREFRTLAENSPDIIMRYDSDCQRTYVNPAYVRETHVPMMDALNVTPRAQWHASITPPVEEYIGVLRKVMASGEPADLTVSWRRTTDDSIVFHALRIVAEREAGGRVVGTLAIGRNITAQKLVEQELKEREQRYRGIFDNVLDTLYLLEVTPEGRFRNLEVNPAFEKSSGMSSAELIGKFIEETVPQEIAEIVTAKYRRCIEAGTAIDEEAALDLPSGLRHYHSTLVPVRDDSGRIHRIVGISRDITERKRMEEALATREREFRTLAENSPDPIYRYDRDCRRLYVNPVVGRILGKPVEELIGSSPADGAILVSEQNRKVMQAIHHVFDSGETGRIDLNFIDQDGQNRDYQMLLVPEHDAGGQVATVLAMARDVTAIRDAERRMSRFFANVPGFVYSFRMSPDGHFSFPFASPGIEDIYGVRPEDVVDDATTITAHVLHPDDVDRVTAGILESARTLAPYQIEFRVALPGRGERWIESRALPEREAEGGTLWHGLMLDITERKRMERHLEESQHLLRQLANRNETAREDERKHLKREIHDELGQYLLALRLGVSIVDLQFGGNNPPLREKTIRLIEMVDSTIKVVRNVVASLRPAALELGIVSALEWLVGEYSAQTGIQCELHVAGADIPMDEDRATAIFRIAQESLTNIVRHAKASGVKMTLERTGDDLILEVRDNGVGFDAALRKDKSFGLVSIRERALMLGGEVDISSTSGHGTSIRVHIPIHNAVSNALSES